jgi:hypothetical protein
VVEGFIEYVREQTRPKDLDEGVAAFTERREPVFRGE